MIEARFPGMGSAIHVALVGGSSRSLDTARERLEHLEAAWSRFRSDSEISRLNDGGWTTLSAETIELLRRAIAGWERTHGRFDPTVQRAMVALGYDRPFAAGLGAPPAEPRRSPGCAGIEIEGDRARLPDGVGFDPGGIGKGFAADLVATELSDSGIAGVMVNVGGDLRAMGESPGGAGWGVRVAEPGAGLDVVVGIAEGAVATSSRLRRTWGAGDDRRHHLVDTTTGLPTPDTAPLAATVVAAEGWWAEVCSKAAMTAPAPLLESLLDEASALVVGPDGVARSVNGMERYLR